MEQKFVTVSRNEIGIVLSLYLGRFVVKIHDVNVSSVSFHIVI
jgi:hypothetical protein